MAAHHTNPYLVTTPFNSSVGMQETYLEEWQEICDRDPDTHTHKGATARLQDDLYFRCNYMFKGRVYTCICKHRPVNIMNACRIEPAGQGPHDWDSLQKINVPRNGDDVWWDTDHNEITDKTRDRIGMAA